MGFDVTLRMRGFQFRDHLVENGFDGGDGLGQRDASAKPTSSQIHDAFDHLGHAPHAALHHGL